MTTKTPRGIRNNNPLNIRKGADKWQGMAAAQPDTQFVTFASSIWGIRAAARLLINYQDKHDLNTVHSIIGRWAPENGDSNGAKAGGEYKNHTAAYRKAVAVAMGVGVTERINVHEYHYLRPMLEAMVRFENGVQPYSDAEYDKALVLAGVEPAAKPLEKSRTIKGAKVAAIGTVASVGIQAAEQGGAIEAIGNHITALSPAIPLVETLATYAPYVLGLLVVVAAGYIAFARWDDSRKGLR